MDERQQQKEKLTDEDKKRIILTVAATEEATNIELTDRADGDLREQIDDLVEQVNKLAARRIQQMGRVHEHVANFWAMARADSPEMREWFRRMRDFGMQIAFRRIKDETTGNVMGVEVYAFDPEEEAAKRIRKLFKRIDSEEHGQ